MRREHTAVNPTAESPDFSPAEIDVGRRLFAGEWSFLGPAGAVDRLPPFNGIEIAFAGRSNVGKSSLINALTGRRALARTSNTPGRTQELLFFGNPRHRLTLVDMPGYGYAVAGKEKVARWARLIRGYLQTRVNLARVYVLVDSRHELKSGDEDMLDVLSQAAVSHQIVLTKCDQISEATLARCGDIIKAAIAKRPAAFPDLIATSAHTGAGIERLRAAIARLVEERGPLVS
jgi:GTP-binding protein